MLSLIKVTKLQICSEGFSHILINYHKNIVMR